MFRSLRRATEALQALQGHMAAIQQVLEEWPREASPEPTDLSPVTDRIDRLEMGYAKWQAEADATMLRADAVFKNARNAEERARSKMKKADDDEGESDEFNSAYQAYMESRAEGEAQVVNGGVALTGKARRLRAKFR